MKVLIRDDDTCYFTKVKELEYCYSDTNIPICLSVTPFRVAGKYLKTEKDRTKEYALHENPELVQYLKDGIGRKKYSIALHGYTHVYYNDDNKSTRIPEYAINEGLIDKTKEGKEYLERLLKVRINTFVPPSNRISKSGIRAIETCDLNLMNIPSFNPKKRPINIETILNYVKLRFWRIKTRSQIYPLPLNFGGHQEMKSCLLYPSSSIDDIKRTIDLIDNHNGVLVLATHYHAFNKRIKSGETIKEAFYKLIDYFNSKNKVEFITYGDLWS